MISTVRFSGENVLSEDYRASGPFPAYAAPRDFQYTLSRTLAAVNDLDTNPGYGATFASVIYPREASTGTQLRIEVSRLMR